MSKDVVAGSSPWLASLIGQAWAPQPPKLSCERIQTLARRGFKDPSMLSVDDVRELCASVVAHGVPRIS